MTKRASWNGLFVGWFLLVGLSPFISGSLINRQADRILRHLRPQGEAGYRIPQSGLYAGYPAPITWVRS